MPNANKHEEPQPRVILVRLVTEPFDDDDIDRPAPHEAVR